MYNLVTQRKIVHMMWLPRPFSNRNRSAYCVLLKSDSGNLFKSGVHRTHPQCFNTKRPVTQHLCKWRTHLRGYCTSGPYFLRPFAFSQKIKQLWTKKPMDLVTNVPRNSKITVLLQQRQLLWSYSEKCTKINILHVLNHKSITTWVSEIPVQLLGSLECYL